MKRLLLLLLAIAVSASSSEAHDGFGVPTYGYHFGSVYGIPVRSHYEPGAYYRRGMHRPITYQRVERVRGGTMFHGYGPFGYVRSGIVTDRGNTLGFGY